MIDRGLALSMALIGAMVWLTGRVAPPKAVERDQLFDALAAPVLLGLLVGRLVAMALSDLRGLAQVRDVLIIRGGVEFWPAVAVGTLVAARKARRDGLRPSLRVVDLAPFVLVGMATYDATCLVREGCFGPTASIGLAPPGVASTMVPVGLLTAAALLGLAAAAHRWGRRRSQVALAAIVTFVAAERAVASIWLPRFGPGPTRQHVESVVVAVIASGWLALAVVRSRSPDGRFGGRPVIEQP
jgi:hypothetical protein